LKLTRRIGESLMIGEDVTLTVFGIQNNQIKISIKAPKHIAVHREEIYQKIQDGATEETEEILDSISSA